MLVLLLVDSQIITIVCLHVLVFLFSLLPMLQKDFDVSLSARRFPEHRHRFGRQLVLVLPLAVSQIATTVLEGIW